jgi:hypothetical protein
MELTTSIEKQRVFEKIHLAIKDCTVGYDNYSQAASSIIRVKSNFILLLFPFYILYFLSLKKCQLTRNFLVKKQVKIR